MSNIVERLCDLHCELHAELARETGVHTFYADKLQAWASLVLDAATIADKYDRLLPEIESLRSERDEARKNARVLSDPCVQKLKDDEPFFVLLGRDPDAGTAIAAWINSRMISEGETPKVKDAIRTFNAFDNYRSLSSTEVKP